MRLYKLRVCLLIVWLVQNCSFAQENLEFPVDFIGSYEGNLTIKNAQSEKIVKMEFHLKPTDSPGTYEYQIVYIANGNREERNYTLVERDKANGDYVVDENNGILLEAKLIGNRLISVFEVQESLLITTEIFFEDQMIFEIVFSKTDSKSVSGNVGTSVPEVYSYPVSVYQFARLKKVID